MAEGRPLTHNELWDDTVLQDSWNEAVEEYNVRECVSLSLDSNILTYTIALSKFVCSRRASRGRIIRSRCEGN